MNSKKDILVQQLNSPERDQRLKAVSRLREMIDDGLIPKPERGKDTNNHVHTSYSFSPYSPSAAVYQAYMAGLCTVGIIDHDSISGAREFIEAGKRMGITTTIGCEVRVNFDGTKLEGKKINNPDEPNVAYIALHGLPHNKIDDMDSLLCQIREQRDIRNREQLARLNDILKPYDIQLDYDTDVLPISMAADGGSVTERHILMALTRALVKKYGRGKKLLDFLRDDMKIAIAPAIEEKLMDTDFFAYDYDVLNVLKTALVPRFFIAGGADSFPVADVVNFARKLGAIPTYCYLGDVGDSPTGDKKAEKFEDDYLDELFPVVKELGFEAISYMPSRNTEAQLKRVISLCRQYEFMEISGEDINQPRQSFVCPKLREPMFSHLADNTWALVGHENAATKNPQDSIFSMQTKQKYPVLNDRLAHYVQLGLPYRR